MFPTRFLRVSILNAATAAITLGFLSLPATTAYAAAPMVKTSAPGFYRMMLGDFEITALSDGTVKLPVDKLLSNTTTAAVDATLAKYDLSSPVETSVNGYLVNTGNKLILFDTGAAKLFGPTLGKLAANIQAAGYKPEQIDEIYITHMHPDHVGGLMAGDQLVFPNATVHADQHDADFWLSQKNLDKAAADDKGFFQGAMTSLNPYIKAGKFKPFNGNTEFDSSVKTIASYGHTPGHTSYMVQSKGQKLAIWGDLIHVGAVQFDHPEVTIQFDSNTGAAALARKKAYIDAAKQRYLVAAAHLSFPGIGHIRSQNNGYVWMPVNYISLP